MRGKGIAICGLVGAVLLVAGAGAAITPSTNAADFAAAITSDPSYVTGASFVTIPPGGTPDAVSTTPLVGFPTNGSSYAILTNGDATAAANAPQPQVPGPDDEQSASDGGQSVRGDSDFDVTILKVDLNVPASANCLSFDFRYLTEEYPEYVGQQFNDAFIAELDSSTWTTSGSTITAPNNFAFDTQHNVISVNAAGAASVDAQNSAGTVYRGATPLLTATTPITAGAHSLYLSIFDQGDDILDSAAFVDNLVLGRTAGGACQKGVQVSQTGPPSGTTTGTVLVGGKPYTGGPIPYGSQVDVTKGGVDLKTRAGELEVEGRGETAQFVILKGKLLGGKPLDILRLVGGNFKQVCGANGFRAFSPEARKPPSKKSVRRLFTKGKGSFQTQGQYSSATVRGTSWETDDRCDGTWVHTFQGTVAVFDKVKKKTVLVTAGKSYLAQKP